MNKKHFTSINCSTYQTNIHTRALISYYILFLYYILLLLELGFLAECYNFRAFGSF